MHCGIVDTVGLVKKSIQEEYLRSPIAKHLKMKLVRTGSLIPDETPLCDILGKYWLYAMIFDSPLILQKFVFQKITFDTIHNIDDPNL